MVLQGPRGRQRGGGFFAFLPLLLTWGVRLGLVALRAARVARVGVRAVQVATRAARVARTGGRVARAARKTVGRVAKKGRRTAARKNQKPNTNLGSKLEVGDSVMNGMVDGVVRQNTPRTGGQKRSNGDVAAAAAATPISSRASANLKDRAQVRSSTVTAAAATKAGRVGQLSTTPAVNAQRSVPYRSQIHRHRVQVVGKYHGDVAPSMTKMRHRRRFGTGI